MIEIWKPIFGYEGIYSISDHGKIKSHVRKFRTKEKILKNYKDKNGYFKVSLSSNGIKKLFKIHQLVCINFLNKDSFNLVVNHKDGNKENNHVSNLEYITSSQNSIHAFNIGLRKILKGSQIGTSKLNEKEIITIRNIHSKGGITCKELASMYKVDISNIALIVKKRSWKHL